LGLTLPINATQYAANLGQTPTIVLAGPRSPLLVLASNVDWFETGAAGVIGSQVTDRVTVPFNQSISATPLQAPLKLDNGALAPAMPMPTVAGNLLTVAFSKPLDTGKRYNL